MKGTESNVEGPPATKLIVFSDCSKCSRRVLVAVLNDVEAYLRALETAVTRDGIIDVICKWVVKSVD